MTVYMTKFYACGSVQGLQIKNKTMTQKQLLDTLIEHYKSGVISNLYTVVLQLDVLGNPYQLLTGAFTGVTSLITEPFEVWRLPISK